MATGRLAKGRLRPAAEGARNRRVLAAVDKFADETMRHMALEESTVLPLAKKHLTGADWVEIGAAFSENGDPRFDAEADQECRDLFTRIVNLAPPPIGVGPARKQ